MSGKKSGGDGDKSNYVWPFFAGVFDGAINRPGYLGQGALRTGAWAGLNGIEARNNIVLHNYLTRQAGMLGFNYLRGADVDPVLLLQIWQHLPEDARSNTVQWGAKTAGGIVGGAIIGNAISGQLVKVIPKKFVVPSMLFIGCQGFMASIWRDAWGGGPPPPPGGMGGGGGGISV